MESLIAVIICVLKPGKELTTPHQMSLAGAISLPAFWLAGAGAAVFWVLGKPNHIILVLCYSFESLFKKMLLCFSDFENIIEHIPLLSAMLTFL